MAGSHAREHAYQNSITRAAAAANHPAGTFPHADPLSPLCGGLDVHKDTIMACVRWVSAPEQPIERRELP